MGYSSELIPGLREQTNAPINQRLGVAARISPEKRAYIYLKP